MNKQTSPAIALFVLLIALGAQSMVVMASKETVTLCHMQGSESETREVSEGSVDGHLNHGDYLGPCIESSSSSSSSESSSSSSSSSSESSSSSSSSSDTSSSRGDIDHPIFSEEIPASHGGGGGGSTTVRTIDVEPIFRGHGLAQHASAVDFILSKYLLQSESSYSFGIDGNEPEGFVSLRGVEKPKREHAALCSMFRYFQQLQVVRPFTPDDYIDWIAEKLSVALGEDHEQMKAALLGRPPLHPYAGDLLPRISDQGCAANEYVFIPVDPADALKEAAPVSEDEPASEPATVPQGNASDESGGLTIKDETTDTNIIFALMKGNKVFTDIVVSLTHEVHIIAIRDDLQHFYHIHPQRDAHGMWRIPFAPTAAGTYWIYMNFSDSEGRSYALRFTHTYPGGDGEKGEILNFDLEKSLDGYRFQLQPLETVQGMTFTYKIIDALGQRARVQEFMGAFGHQVIISAGGYFNHSHPVNRVNHDPVFYFSTPPLGTYMVIVVFQIDGKEYLIPYQWVR